MSRTKIKIKKPSFSAIKAETQKIEMLSSVLKESIHKIDELIEKNNKLKIENDALNSETSKVLEEHDRHLKILDQKIEKLVEDTKCACLAHNTYGLAKMETF